jgi:predicted transcriptional regulator
MTTVTIRIPEGLRKNLEKLCRQQKRSSSDVVRESLRTYLALEEMNQLREKLRPHAEAAGILTDDDVFKAVS